MLKFEEKSVAKRLNGGGKTDSKLSANVGFVCDEACVFSNMVKYTSCVTNKLVSFKHFPAFCHEMNINQGKQIRKFLFPDLSLAPSTFRH